MKLFRNTYEKQKNNTTSRRTHSKNIHIRFYFKSIQIQTIQPKLQFFCKKHHPKKKQIKKKII